MKKIFISGIKGLIGSNLARGLVAKGHKVTGCDNLSGKIDNQVPCNWFNFNCNNKYLMGHNTKGFDLIIHASCLPYEGLSVVSPHLITENITRSTNSVMKAAITNKCDVLFLSSMARYGINKTPFTEDMIPQPVDPYGIAKLYSEQLIKNLCDTYDLKWNIVVPHNVIGVGQRYDDPYRNVVSIFINSMLQGITPKIYGNGTQTRAFSSVRNFTESVIKLIESDISGEVINIGDNMELSINKMYNMVQNIIDFGAVPEYVPQRKNEVNQAYCSHNKALNLGLILQLGNLRECITSMVEWIKEQGTKPFDYNLPIEFDRFAPKHWKQGEKK